MVGSQRVIVLDADSRVEPGFLAAMRRGWQGQNAAYQAHIVPALLSDSPIGRLAGFSELTEQSGSDKLSALLGLPVRLRGTGMGLTSSVLEELAPELRTAVEDAELSLLLAARGIPIRPIQEARVLDPKPRDRMAAARSAGALAARPGSADPGTLAPAVAAGGVAARFLAVVGIDLP